MKYEVEVLDTPVRYEGNKYYAGNKFVMDEKHINEGLVNVLEEVFEAPKTIEEMTVPELKKYAKDNDIDLGDAKKKEEILEVIQAAENEDDGENDQTPPEE